MSRGTRTKSGAPGPKYWQQWTDYRLQAELNPISKRLTGQGSLTYHNRSPDTLEEVYVQLLHNLFAPGARHNTDVPWSVEGVGLDRVVAQGQELKRSRRKASATRSMERSCGFRLPPPAASRRVAAMEFTWRLRIPPDGAPRGGQDGEIYYINYWYPQMAVYDDVNGWQIDQYLGNAEFYMGYGNYDVALTLPEGWLVTATGTLQNAERGAFAADPRPAGLSRPRPRGSSGSSAEADRTGGHLNGRGTDGKLTWRFHADSVRDVSWATSSKYLWDATNAAVGDAERRRRPDTTADQRVLSPGAARQPLGSERPLQPALDRVLLSRYLCRIPIPT